MPSCAKECKAQVKRIRTDTAEDFEVTFWSTGPDDPHPSKADTRAVLRDKLAMWLTPQPIEGFVCPSGCKCVVSIKKVKDDDWGPETEYDFTIKLTDKVTAHAKFTVQYATALGNCQPDPETPIDLGAASLAPELGLTLFLDDSAGLTAERVRSVKRIFEAKAAIPTNVFDFETGPGPGKNPLPADHKPLHSGECKPQSDQQPWPPDNAAPDPHKYAI